MTSAAERTEKLCPLYRGQKMQRFHGQFRVTLSSRLPASLGGRIGPCSNRHGRPSIDDCCCISSPPAPIIPRRLEETHLLKNQQRGLRLKTVDQVDV